MAASAITWNDVVAHEPDLAGTVVSPAAQMDILDHVNNSLAVNEFGGDDDPRLRLARIYLAAHMGTVVVSGSRGPVISQTVGPISQSFAAATAGEDSMYSSTSWGRMYLQIVRTSVARIPFTV